MKCGAGSTPAAPRCPNAIAVCESLPECSTIDVNVEGSVATLKRETALSRRTSGMKDVDVRVALAEPQDSCRNDLSHAIPCLLGSQTCHRTHTPMPTLVSLPMPLHV